MKFGTMPSFAFTPSSQGFGSAIGFGQIDGLDTEHRGSA
jgi:hypothetical protein